MTKVQRKTKYFQPSDPAQTPKSSRPRFLRRYIVLSDHHHFVTRMYKLGMCSFHFDTYEELARHADCRYVMDVDCAISSLARRVESLNSVGDMLWPEPIPAEFSAFPLSRYEWLTTANDVFLIRYISVVDCALILTSEVYELDLGPRWCTLSMLKRRGVPNVVTSILDGLVALQGGLREERNARVHHGREPVFTLDDQTFKLASIFEHRANGMTGTDRFGRRIHLPRMFKEGLVELQRKFNGSTKRLVRHLDSFYDELWGEFEDRFSAKARVATHGLIPRRPD